MNWGTASPPPARFPAHVETLGLGNLAGYSTSELRKGGCLPHLISLVLQILSFSSYNVSAISTRVLQAGPDFMSTITQKSGY